MKVSIFVFIIAISFALFGYAEVDTVVEQHLIDTDALVRNELTKLLSTVDASVVLKELNALVERDLGASNESSPVDEHTDEHTDGHTDDHTDDHAGSSHVSIFGSVSHIEPIIGTISMIIIIFAVLFLQSLFQGLHSFTADTSFNTMVVRIENELMIVGCSAFIFKIILNTTSFLNEEWTLALEFAELLIPLLSFCYCGIGILLIVMALRQCDLWSKAYNLKLIELVDVYLIRVKSIWFRYVDVL